MIIEKLSKDQQTDAPIMAASVKSVPKTVKIVKRVAIDVDKNNNNDDQFDRDDNVAGSINGSENFSKKSFSFISNMD